MSYTPISFRCIAHAAETESIDNENVVLTFIRVDGNQEIECPAKCVGWKECKRLCQECGTLLFFEDKEKDNGAETD